MIENRADGVLGLDADSGLRITLVHVSDELQALQPILPDLILEQTRVLLKLLWIPGLIKFLSQTVDHLGNVLLGDDEGLGRVVTHRNAVGKEILKEWNVSKSIGELAHSTDFLEVIAVGHRNLALQVEKLTQVVIQLGNGPSAQQTRPKLGPVNTPLPLQKAAADFRKSIHFRKLL